MSELVRVRPAERAELEVVGRITLLGYAHDGFLTADDNYAGELLDAFSRADNAEVLVAEHNGTVVGTVTFCPPGSSLRELSRPGQGEFRMLAVDPDARGLGAGRALVARCFDRCSELGLTEMVLCSMTEMTAAHALYASFGFVRDPSLDWQPVPGVTLLAFRATV
ncbi:MAG: GNAT family N-acetyltransferase [Nocardioidaceae bacterium]